MGGELGDVGGVVGGADVVGGAVCVGGVVGGFGLDVVCVGCGCVGCCWTGSGGGELDAELDEVEGLGVLNAVGLVAGGEENEEKSEAGLLDIFEVVLTLTGAWCSLPGLPMNA